VASLVKINRWYRCLSSMTADIRQSALLNRKGRGRYRELVWWVGRELVLCLVWTLFSDDLLGDRRNRAKIEYRRGIETTA
jgi:hypothetical protein